MSCRLDIHVSKGWTLAWITAAFALAALMALCALVPGMSLFCVVSCGLIGCWSAYLCFVDFPRQFLRTGPPFIVIDDRGIEDFQSRLGLVEWTDIRSLEATKYWLLIEVADPQKYLDRMSVARRAVVQACRSLGAPTVTIRFAGLTHTATEAVVFCRSRGGFGSKSTNPVASDRTRR